MQPSEGMPDPYLAQMVGWDTTHVVVHGGKYRDGILGDINAREDLRRLTDARKAFREQIGRKVVQMLFSQTGGKGAFRRKIGLNGARVVGGS